MAASPMPGTSANSSSGALSASAKVLALARGLVSRRGAEQDQLEQLVIGEGIGARLAEASPKPLVMAEIMWLARILEAHSAFARLTPVRRPVQPARRECNRSNRAGYRAKMPLTCDVTDVTDVTDEFPPSGGKVQNSLFGLWPPAKASDLVHPPQCCYGGRATEDGLRRTGHSAFGFARPLVRGPTFRL